MVTAITPTQSLAGVTANVANVTIDYDGASPIGSIANVDYVVTALDPNTDWASRSAGAFFRHNWAFKDTAQTLPVNNTADMVASFGNANSAALGGTAVLDTVNKLSGPGSCKFRMLASEPGNNCNVGFSFAGIATAAKTAIKHEFYVQFAIYADSIYRDFYYGPSNTWGGKIAIIESVNQSNDNGEIVFRRDNRAPGGYVHGYRRTRTGAYNYYRLLWAAYNEFTSHTFYDRGSPVVTNINTLQQRYGPTYNDRSTNGADADIDAAGTPGFLQSNGWTVFECYVKQVASGNSIIKWWAAPYGQAPRLFMGVMNADLPLIGAVDGLGGELYNGFQLTNYHNTVTNWPAADTFISYAALIASDNPIPFPGGYDIPANELGASLPFSYPPSGSVEQT